MSKYILYESVFCPFLSDLCFHTPAAVPTFAIVKQLNLMA